jgi:hypothetical protein
MRLALHFPDRPAVGARPRGRRIWRLVLPLIPVLAYLASPYWALKELDHALVLNDRTALAHRVDLHSIREAMGRRLNKDTGSNMEPPSSAFVDWLQRAIRRDGTQALERAVDLDWVRGRLLSHSPAGSGMAPALERAFFDDPLHFSLRIGAPGQSPVHARMTFRGLGWRLTELSY